VTATYSFLYSETTNEGHTIGNEIGLTLGHQVNAQTTVGLLGSFAYRTGTDTTEDDYNIATVGVFGSYNVPGIWSAYLALGYSGFDPSSGATDGALGGDRDVHLSTHPVPARQRVGLLPEEPGRGEQRRGGRR
jgi:hypothetical protein